MVNYNTTFYQFSDESQYVYDQRGFNTIIKGQASEYLNCTEDYDCSADPRLLLNTIVTNISYSEEGVVVLNEDESCIAADYAIVTFSVGVLQNEVVSFDPPLPEWKENSIATFQLGTYTKIWMQFPPDQVFWNTSVQFFLYADPLTRGYYPLFQSLDHEEFLPGSGILFVTVVEEESYTVEAQDAEVTKAQVLEVLRNMFGEDNVPEPTAFLYPRWSFQPWAFGSYSNWPPGVTLEQHQNLRANVERVFFAGEATSAQYFGYLQGAYTEGKLAGETVAECVKQGGTCRGYDRVDVLYGTTEPSEYNVTNGWLVSSFDTYGLDIEE